MNRECADLADATSVAFVQFFHDRERLLAWFAPGGPEIDQNNFGFGGIGEFALELEGGEVGEGVAGFDAASAGGESRER